MKIEIEESALDSLKRMVAEMEKDAARAGELEKLAWVLLDEIDKERCARPGESDWTSINKADDEMRAALSKE